MTNTQQFDAPEWLWAGLNTLVEISKAQGHITLFNMRGTFPRAEPDVVLAIYRVLDARGIRIVTGMNEREERDAIAYNNRPPPETNELREVRRVLPSSYGMLVRDRASLLEHYGRNPKPWANRDWRPPISQPKKF